MKILPTHLNRRHWMAMNGPRLAQLTMVQASDSGLTLVEVLLSSIMAGIIVATTLPIMLIAVSSRVQTYRTEQAMELAQGEIDRVRTLMAEGVTVAEEAEELPPDYGGTTLSGSIQGVAAPTSIFTGSGAIGSFTEARPIDIDEDGKIDFLLQTFRDAGSRFLPDARGGGELGVFNMGVRVYDIAAEDNLGSLDTDPLTLTVTQGVGNRRLKPLVTLQTEMSRSDIETSLERYIDLLD